MAEDCLFCRIVNGELAAEIVHEDDDYVAFRDINPQAPTHILIVPKTHIATLNELTDANADLVGRMVLRATALADVNGISESGFRLILNCNQEGGQTVYHIHMHLLGGRQLRALG